MMLAGLGLQAILLFGAAQGATKPLGEILVAETPMLVEGAELSDSMPPGCGTLRPGCSKEADGYDILIVWLRPRTPPPEGKSSWDLPFFDEIMDFKADDVLIVSSDGEKTKKSSGGSAFVGDKERYFIAFTPRETSKGFVLHYGKQPPVSLGR